MSPDPLFRPRVLVARPGLEAHDHGVLLVADALRAAGMEVLSPLLPASVAAIAQAAVEEEVDVIGLSVICGNHLAICARLREELTIRGRQDLPVVAAGRIPLSDGPLLGALGVRRICGPDACAEEIVECVRWLVEPKAWVAPAPSIAATTA